MQPKHSKIGGFLTASALAAVLAACAGSNYETSQATPADYDETAMDTIGYPGNVGDAGQRSDRSRIYPEGEEYDQRAAVPSGTEEEGGAGVGGTGEVYPYDPTVTDTAAEYGDPNAWPTGPLPGDTGVGGAGSPMPDTVWMDTLEPGDTLIIPDAAMPGSTGPDVW